MLYRPVKYEYTDLEKKYLSVDYVSHVFQLAQMSSSPPAFPASPVPFNSTPITCSKSESSGLPRKTVIGIAVGLPIAVTLIAGLLCYFYRRQIRARWSRARILGTRMATLPGTDSDGPPHLETYRRALGAGALNGPIIPENGSRNPLRDS
jgi:hypothetical protein